MDLVQGAMLALGALAVLVGLRLVYIWRTRIRPLVPSLELEWAADCEHLTTATVDGSSITFHNVRDFKWRTTKDRDENWADEVRVDLDDLKDVWFIVDHFHSIKGLAHTPLSSVKEPAFRFPLNRVGKKANATTLGTVCGGRMNSICWLVLNEMLRDCAPTVGATRTTCSER